MLIYLEICRHGMQMDDGEKLLMMCQIIMFAMHVRNMFNCLNYQPYIHVSSQ